MDQSPDNAITQVRGNSPSLAIMQVRLCRIKHLHPKDFVVGHEQTIVNQSSGMRMPCGDDFLIMDTISVNSGVGSVYQIRSRAGLLRWIR